MNFLSTGEKIKRARIYKGVTLKELCQKDISISKMSCIENDKIKADTWVLEMVADRLELDVNYLLYNDIMELENSIITYETKVNLNDDDFRGIKERINYCLLKDYKALAFKFTHIIFSEYTKRRNFNSIKEIMSIYNEFSELSEQEEQIYYGDLAKYFLARRNYNDAVTYFNRTINHIFNYKTLEKNYCYMQNSLFLVITHYMNHDYEKASVILENLLNIDESKKSKEQEILLNGLLAAVNIKLEKDFEFYINEFDRYEFKQELKYSQVRLLVAKSYIEANKFDLAEDIIKNTKECINSSNIYGYVEILLSATKLLSEIKEINIAKSYCEEALEISIKLDNHFLIEKSYLYKARINRAERSLIQWEMNMNLATDILIKFATADEKKERYIEMAEMYHIIGELRESLKYLTLSMNLEKNIQI